MADRSSERDRRVRQLMGNKNPGFDVIGQAQAEIQDAQSELYNHIALQNAHDQSRLRESSTISQVAGTMLQQQGDDQLRMQAATMNPSTQATLGKFGVKPQRSQNTTRGVQNQRVVTKTGDTTNIRNENITNNRTDIKITQPSIPIQTPVIPMRGGNGPKEDSTAKFKTWLSGMFARQQNEAEIQRKEYRKKEWNLGRTTSKLMKKIGEATSNLGERLDPKNMTSSLGGQLKWLLLIFGATMIGKVWKPMMKFLANLEGGFKAAFGLPMNTDLQKSANKGVSIVDKLKEAIGIDSKNEDTNLIQGIGRVFMQGIDKLIDKLQFWFEDRAMAMKEVEFPDMGNLDFSSMGGILGSAMEGVVASLKNVGQYLGDLMTVALGGSKGKVKVEANRIQRKVNQSLTNTNGKQVSDGDSALITGKGRNYMRESDFDMFGNLKGKASSTMAMSQSVLSMLNDKSGVRHTAEIASGVSQLFHSADRNGQVVIDPELLLQLGLSQQDLITLQKNGNLSEKPYRIIAVKASDAQKKEMGAYYGSWGTGILSTVGTAAGAVVGTPILGGVVGGVLGGGVGSLIDNFITYCTENDYYPTLVPADSPQMSEDGSAGVPKMMWVLNKRGADQVKGKITYGMNDKTTDLTNVEFTNYIRKVQENVARRNNIKLKGESTNFENLRAAQAQYKNYQDQWNWKFESTDKNSENNIKYGNWNAAVNTAGNLLTSAQSGISNAFRVGGNYFVRKSISNQDIIDNMNYTMDKLIKAGFSKEAAAGIAGNIMRECSFNPNLKVTDSDGLPSGGIVMWHAGNLDKIERHFNRDIRNISLDEQLNYLINELKTTKASNRDGVLNRYGLNSGMTVFDAMNNVANEEYAANLFERAFEGSQDYNLNSNSHRIGYAKEALYQYNNHQGNEFRSIQLTTVKNKKPSLINLSNNNGNVKSGSCSVAWIGDSQTCAVGGLWPRLVGEGLELGDSFAYFGRSSAIPRSYLNGVENKLGDPVTNKRIGSCKEMLKFIESSRPEYVIIALGHNGVDGYQSLVSGIKSSGSKVIGIKMWPIDGSKYGMSTYTSDQMKKMYEGINVDGWVDLTDIRPPKSDGVHVNSPGCKYVAEETLRQLIGAEDNSNIINDLSGSLGNIMLDISNFTNPNYNKDGNSDNPLLNQFTPEQQEIIKSLRSFQANNEVFNAQSYLDRGAKINEQGDIYYEIETERGTVRAELNTDGTSALGGYQMGSVNSMYIYNKNTGYRDYDLTQDERQSIEKSIAIDINSYLTKYEGRATPSDVMKGPNGDLIKLRLNEFGYEDYDSYSEEAKKAIEKQIKKSNDGKSRIPFEITPTRDRRSFAIIWTKEIDLPVIKLSSEKNESGNYIDYYRSKLGPQIYVLGKKWLIPGTLPEDNQTTDWQPTAFYHNVRLTPKATADWENLKKILALGDIQKRGDKFYATDDKGNETELNEEQLRIAQRAGIFDRIGVGFSRDNLNGKVLFKVNEGYSYAQKIANTIISDTKDEFLREELNNYLNNYGKTEEERLDYIKNNKDKDVFFIGGKIYGKGGIVLGEYDPEDESKIKLYDENNMVDYINKYGQQKLNDNINLIKGNQLRKYVSNFGTISNEDKYDTIKKFYQNYYNPATEEEQKELSKKQIFVRGVDITEGKLKYRVHFDSKGNPFAYFIKDSDLEKYLGVPVTKFGEKKFNSRKELLDYVLELKANALVLNENKDNIGIADGKLTDENGNITSKIPKNLNQKITKKYEELKNQPINKYSDEVDYNSGDSELQKLTSYLVKKGKLLLEITTEYSHYDKSTKTDQYKQNITYYDYEFENTHFRVKKLPKDFKDSVNAIIGKYNDELNKLRFNKIYENSGLQAGYQEIANKANAGTITVTDNGNGTVITQTGETLFVEDDGNGNRKYKAPTSDQAYDILINQQLESEDFKKKMYKKMFGAEIENGNLYLYNKQRTVRYKIDTTMPFTTDLKQLLHAGNYEGRESKNDQWKPVNPEDSLDLNGNFSRGWMFNTDGLYTSLDKSIISNVKENSAYDLAAEQIDEMIEKLGIQVDQGYEAEKRELLREKREKERDIDIREMVDYTRIMAKALTKDDEEAGKEVEDVETDSGKKRTEVDKAAAEGLRKISKKHGIPIKDIEVTTETENIPKHDHQTVDYKQGLSPDTKIPEKSSNSGFSAVNPVVVNNNGGNKVDINNNYFGFPSLTPKAPADGNNNGGGK